MHIIKADLDHQEIISQLYNESFSKWINKYGILYGYKRISSDEVKLWLGSPNSTSWISYCKNEPVGYAHCEISEINGVKRFTTLTFVETKESFGQSKIVTHPNHCRQGIATFLLRTILKYYKQQNLRNASIFSYNNNIEATGLLQKLGFQHKPLYFDEYYSKTKNFQCDSVLATLNLDKSLPNVEINKNINIRPLKRIDLVGMIDIFRLCRPDVFGGHPTSEDILTWFNSDWAEETLVAEVNNNILGCMEFSSLGIVGIPGVLPKYQKQGIGTTLFYSLLQRMKDKGKDKALVDTGFVFPNAIKLYKRLNFDISHELWNWVKTLK